MKNVLLPIASICLISAVTAHDARAQTAWYEVASARVSFKAPAKVEKKPDETVGVYEYTWKEDIPSKYLDVFFSSDTTIAPSSDKATFNQCVSIIASNKAPFANGAASADVTGQDFTVQFYSDDACATLISSVNMPGNPSTQEDTAPASSASTSNANWVPSSTPVTFSPLAKSLKFVPLPPCDTPPN